MPLEGDSIADLKVMIERGLAIWLKLDNLAARILSDALHSRRFRIVTGKQNDTARRQRPHCKHHGRKPSHECDAPSVCVSFNSTLRDFTLLVENIARGFKPKLFSLARMANDVARRARASSDFPNTTNVRITADASK